MDLNKLSFWEDIWKSKFNIEKYKVLYIGSKNITFIQLNKEIKNVNEEYDLGVGFDDTFKVDKYILSIVSIADGMND